MKKIFKFLKMLLWSVLILIILSVAVAEALIYFEVIEMPSREDVVEWVGKIKTKFKQDDEDGEKYTVEMIDAEEYFSDNGEIISEIDVSDAENVEAGADVYAEFTERGFTEYSISSEYSINGDCTDTMDITADSKEKHPVYFTLYCSSADELWTITSINGQITANPISYNFQSESDVSVLVADGNTLMSYDSATNRFYETIPSESAVKLIIVDKVNAATLDNLTIGEMDQYVNK